MITVAGGLASRIDSLVIDCASVVTAMEVQIMLYRCPLINPCRRTAILAGLILLPRDIMLHCIL